MANSGSETGPAVHSKASPKLVERQPQARYILPAAHAFLFLALWAFASLAYHGVAEGFAGPSIAILSAVLWIVDLPFSIVAFGVMFGGGRPETIAAIAWGVGCTLWWYLLGRAIDALIRRKSNS
jgi:hypothetical protein